MRAPLLTLLVACGGTAAVQLDTREAEPRPVAPGPQAEGAPTPVSAPALAFDLGPGEGCAVRGPQLWCWGELRAAPGSPVPIGSAPVPGLTLRGPAPRLVVQEGTACVIDRGTLRCFGALTEEARDQELQALEAQGASIEELAALEAGPYVERLADDVRDVAIAIAGLCWVHSNGRVSCTSLEGESGAFSLPGAVADARRIAMTDDHACVARTDGSVACWGMDAAGVGGETRDGGLIVHEGLDAVDVTAGLGFTCVLDGEGAVTCWGDGLLDDTLFSPETYDETLFPKYTWPNVRAVSIAAGELHACARTESGRVWCLGENGVGQLGDGTTERRAAPVEATELRDASALAASMRSTCVAVGERLRCVGDGTGGTFDGVDRGRRWERVFTEARAMFMDRRGSLVCIVNEQDRLSCVGQGRGEGGLLEAIRRRAPEGMPPTTRALASLDGVPCWLLATGRLECLPGTRAPAARERVAEVEGGLRTLCARHRDGTVFCQGTAHGGSPVVQGQGWQPIDEFAGAVDISVDDMGTSLCGALRSGRVVCRGTIRLGELGAVRDAVSVATSGSSVCARSRNGAVRCVRSGSSSTTAEDVEQLAFYDLHPCFLGEDGTLECREHGRHPVQAPVAAVTEVAASQRVLCVRSEAGEVHCRGQGLMGELGVVPPGIAIEAIDVDPFAPAAERATE